MNKAGLLTLLFTYPHFPLLVSNLNFLNYSYLNELILFGGSGCINAYNLDIALVKDKKAPTLELDYPTTKEEIINLISQINDFLKDKKI